MSRLLALALIATFWVANVACSSKVEPQSSRGGNVTQDANSSSIFIGRFACSYPKTLRLAGRSQSIYRVDVRAIQLDDKGGDGLWHKHLAEIRETPPPPDAPDRIIRVYHLDPVTRAVMFYDSTDVPRPRRLDAMRIFGTTAVIASRFGAEGQDADMEILVKHVLNGYLPGADFGFCLETGAVTSELGKNEAAMARFVNPALPGLELMFTTQTVRDPLSMHELSDVEEIRRGTAGAAMKVLKSGHHSAAGLDGLEERIVVTPLGEAPLARFSWKYGGQAFRGDTPQVMIRAVCRIDHQESLTAAWEEILASLRRVPVQKGTR